MITSFGSKVTEKIWNGDRVKNLPREIQQIGRRKLRMLNNSQNLIDLKVPPSNKLEKLSGKMSDFFSIRIMTNGESYLNGTMETQVMLL